MDLRSYFRLFLRHWVAIVVLAALGTAAGAAVTWLKGPQYEAKAEMIVTVDRPGSDLAQSYQGALLAEESAQSYSTLLTSEQVLERLIDELRLPYSVETLRSKIDVSNPASTAIIKVGVNDESAQQAKRIANGIGPVFTDVVVAVDTPDQAPGSGPRTDTEVNVLQPLSSPAQLVPQNKILNIALGLFAGLVAGLGWAVVREITDTRVRDTEDVARATDIPVLAVVPHERAARDQALLSDAKRSPPVVEAYRFSAVGLLSAGSGDRRHVYAITAPRDGETTAATAAGIAVAIAQGGDSVIVADADPLSTRLCQMMGLSGAIGLRDVLDSRVPVDRALQEWRKDLPLRVLGSGMPDPRAYEAAALQEGALDALCEDLERRAKVVILVAPPVLTRADAVVAARVAGAAVIVVRAKATRGDDLEASVRNLRANGVTVLGAVVKDPARRNGHARVPSAPRERVRTDTDGGQGAAPCVTPPGADRSSASPPDEKRGDRLVSPVRR